MSQDSSQVSSQKDFEILKEKMFALREEAQKNRPNVVVLVSDLDQLASVQQAHSVSMQTFNGQQILVSHLNSVRTYNDVSAAHFLSACLNDHINFPPQSVFVITVDPHVGQNGDGEQNIADKRVIVRYEDGTIMIGPARSYMRVGEFHDRGKIESVVEIDRMRLIELGLAEDRGNDVFDGLRRFGPAAAAVLNTRSLLGPQFDMSLLGGKLDPNLIPPLIVPEGTISDIEPGYMNIRLEVPYDRFAYDTDIAIKDANGLLLCIAQRKRAFDGDVGDIVAVNGSKYLITDNTKKTLYLGVIQGHLAKTLAYHRHKKIQVGEQLIVSEASEKDKRIVAAFDDLDKGRSGSAGVLFGRPDAPTTMVEE